MTPSHVVVAPLLVPLVTAVLTLLARPTDRLQRALSLLGGVGYWPALLDKSQVKTTVRVEES